MRVLPSITFLSLALALALPAHAQVGAPAPPTEPPPALEVDSPSHRVLIREGQDGRMLLGGRWYFRADDESVGEAERWFAQRDLTGWSAARVPHTWNATDLTENRATVGWYRKEFRLPRARKGVQRFWTVRFEGANYRATVWLNGRRLGYFVGYFPFELDLKGLRKGRNTLVVKVSSLRGRTDLTHWRPAAFNGYGTGGWWNSGGLLREVYVRAIDTVDVEDVRAIPRLRCLRCPARVAVRTRLRNRTPKARKVGLRLHVRGPGLDERIDLKPRRVPARGRVDVGTRVDIERPRLWQPRQPVLYSLAVSADTVPDERRRSTYRLSFGVRKLESRRGVLFLNGQRLRLRGASIHEDDVRNGAALTPATRTLFLHRLRDLGASVTRSHYPLHPALIEGFDRLGILYWVDAPVYQLPNSFFDLPDVRASARRAVRLTVAGNVNHASVLAWSLANEPAGNRSELGVIGRGLRTFIRDAAADARAIDDTRLIAIDRQSRVLEPVTSPAYRHLDALGVNEYFGWYDSYREDLQREPTTTAELADFLDSIHAANPELPLLITEFGAEATRDGPVSQPGTFQFQTKYVLDHLRIHASKRYVAGSIVWALRDFRVEPTWRGGAPAAYATPPWHNKSLINETNLRKPVYFEVRKRWRRTRPLG
ncbi:MAG TPA: glycoside hydrolase family 2 TIM barrel-domain containing protein [Thermoleophilaceae bacterium]|nr:glycoside hydrolase family 2 TIM barrel-domain containing protein [Thermoleophilaceae bacterium]